VFAPIPYLAWATRFYGKVPYDLATSGVPLVRWSGLGLPEASDVDPSSYLRLRDAIAAYNDVPATEVLPALGTSQAAFLAFAALVSPGDEVLVESPGYEPLARMAEGLGATVRTFPRREDEGFAVAPERVAAAMSARTRAVVVTNLHNPSGVRVPDATLREVAAVAAARGANLVVDEVYAPLDALPEDGVFRGSARKLAPNVVAVASLTKCYGLGMHRIGWVLGESALIERAASALIATCGHLPLTHAAQGAQALASLGVLARRAKERLAGKREIAERWAASIANARWSAPASGLFGLLTLTGAADLLPRIESWATEHGVLVGAGTFFGVPNGFRLSWATLERERFEEGLARLSPLVAAAR
jgi:aspartate/methionine/tyrosine aminotransferase